MNWGATQDAWIYSILLATQVNMHSSTLKIYLLFAIFAKIKINYNVGSPLHFINYNLFGNRTV